jgi:hypothetical protein
MGKCPMDDGGRRMRLPTFHLLLSSTPASFGCIIQPKAYATPERNHVVITTNIRAKGMVKRLEGNVGKHAEGGRKTA